MSGFAQTYRLQPNITFTATGGASLSDSALRALDATPGQEATYTCLPPGY